MTMRKTIAIAVILPISIILTLVLGSLAFAPAAQADTEAGAPLDVSGMPSVRLLSAEEFHQGCSAGTVQSVGPCTIFIEGILDGLNVAAAIRAETPDKFYCLPKVIPDNFLVQVTLWHMFNSKKPASLPVALFVAEAFDLYMCESTR